MLKNIDQKLASHDSVHHDPRPLDLLERGLPFDHDQRSCFDLSHFIGGPDDLVYRLVRVALLDPFILRCEEIHKDIFASQLLQGLAKLRLEDHDHRQQEDLAQVIGNPDDRVQMEQRRQQIKRDDHQSAL